MSSALSGNRFANRGNNFAVAGTDYALNAGAALELLIRGPDRDKMIQRMFNCSDRMSRYLREGKHWTPARLKAASALLGREFDVLVIMPLRSAVNPDELHDQIDEEEHHIQQELDALKGEVRNGFHQIMLCFAALINSEEGHAAVAQDCAAAQEADEPASIIWPGNLLSPERPHPWRELPWMAEPD